MPRRRSAWLRAGILGVLLAQPVTSFAATVAAPAAFAVADRTPVLVLHAVGAQVYECAADAAGGGASWRFREPIAVLMDNGKTVGRHYAGPTWELSDGSAIVGKLQATAPAANSGDISLLKLGAATHRGSGRLDSASLILRLNTRGGNLKGACTVPGELRAQPYAADYAFLR